MKLERPHLFTSGREIAYLSLVLFGILLFSLMLEYSRFNQLTRFDDAVVDADVLHHYVKEKNGREYSVLKLQWENAVFYSSGSVHLRDLRGRRVQLNIKTDQLTFMDYLKGFYLPSRILHIYPELSLQERLRRSIAMQHTRETPQQLYGALFGAAPMDKTLRSQLSALGISHLLAISGFHLGVISLVLYLLLRPVYTVAQQRWFPYRNRRRDLFVFSAVVMLGYLWLLGFVPSLLRAYAMLIIGYLLFDRGIKVVSMQTLLLTIAVLLAFWPRLAFSLGFWLSVGGVYYIFLFLIYFSHWKKWMQLLGVSVWVYLAMLPIALHLFSTFSIWHPLSVLWTLLFNLFYPFTALMHLVGSGEVMDSWLLAILALGNSAETVTFSSTAIGSYLLLSLLALRNKGMMLLLFLVTLTVFVGAVYQVA